MSQITTHVLDGSRGLPASGVTVRLEDSAHELLAVGQTDHDGRIGTFGRDVLPPGTYHLTFETGEYYARLGQATFYPSVTVTVGVEPSTDGTPHYHVPLLLSPFAYSTYRGS